MTTRGLRAMGFDPALLWLLAAPAWVVGRPSGSGEGHGVVGAAVADAAREVRRRHVMPHMTWPARRVAPWRVGRAAMRVQRRLCRPRV